MEKSSAAVSVVQTDELKHNLGRMDLVSIAVRQIIGAGITAMTGTAIGMTGRSVNITFIVTGILCISTAIPQILMGGTARSKRKQYIQVAAFGGQRLAGIFMMVDVFTGLGIAMCVISFTKCLLALVSNTPAKLVAVVVVTLMSGLSILGTKQTAVLQTVMYAVIALAIGAFIASGIPNLQPGYSAPPDFMAKGFIDMLIASAYLSFAADETQYVINFSGEARSPKRDVPFAIIVPTVGISLIYAVMRTIAIGVLPVTEVTNKSLTLVAEAIVLKPVCVLSIVGSVMFTLLTMLSASVGQVCRPVVQAAKDGWLPGFFGKISGKFGTPVNVPLLFYITDLVPVLMRLNISTVSNATVIFTVVVEMILCFTALRLPSVIPKLWNEPRFHVSRGLLNTSCMIDGLVATSQVILLLVTSTRVEIIDSVIILTVAVIYALAVNSKVKMEIGYEGCD